MPIRAVLFDFDGVLADTENVHVAAWERVFDAIGWDVPAERCARAAEIDDRAFFREVLEARGVAKGEGDVEGYVRRKQETAVRLLVDAPRLYPGVAGLVGRLHGRVTLGVVTGTWAENVRTVLSAAGLLDDFAVIVAKEDVTTGKPHPAPYRRALRALKLRAAEAVALEDSPSGLASAQGAGLAVVAIGHRRPEGDWSAGAPYLAGFADVEAAIAALGLASD